MGNSKQRRILRGIGCPAEIEAMEQRLLLSVVPHFKPSPKPVKSKTPAIHAVAKAKSHKAVVSKAAKATAPVTVVPTVNQAATLGDVVTGGPYATPLGGPSNAATAPFTPAQIAQFYGINAISFQGIKGDGTGQTIGIVDAYNNPDLVSSTASNFNTSDLHVFDTAFGLPDPPSFTVVPEEYSTLTTAYNANWAIESALDVEWAHALAPKASIVLVDCNSSSIDDLVNSGVAAAQNAGASVISMSFAFSESGADTYVYDPTFSQTSSITYVAGTGDYGAANTAYPSLSPYVLAAGGTSITTSDSSGSYGSEVVWNNGTNATGGGISQFESKPAYQANESLSGSYRGAPDVAFDGDPATGVYVYDASQAGGGGYYRVGGTSFSSPAWAALIAIANQGRSLNGLSNLTGVSGTMPRLYSLPATDFHDITSGNNALNSGTGYSAGPGYDLASGLGTPVANTLVPDLAGAAAITGRVFIDNNGDHTFDGADTGIAGQTVYLDLNNDGIKESNEPSAITNSSGGYIFTDQPAGGTVRLVSPAMSGYVASTASAAISYGSSDTINITYFPVTYTGNANYTLQMDSTGTTDQILMNGSLIGSVALSQLANLSFTLTGSGDSLTLDATNGNPIPSGGISLTGSIPGDALNVIGTASGNDSFNVSTSSFSFNALPISLTNISALTLNPGTGTDALNISSGSITVLARSSGHGILTRNFSALAVAAGSSAIFANAPLHTDRMLVQASSLSVMGQLDLGGNDMIIHNNTLTNITSLVTGGYSNGQWNGVGIASSAARNDTTQLTALGVIANNLYGGTGQPLFDGVAPLTTDILIKYTFYGDSNLDGKVDGTDYSRIDNGILMHQTGWANGDFNYDTVTNGTDYTLIDNAYNRQGGQM